MVRRSGAPRALPLRRRSGGAFRDFAADRPARHRFHAGPSACTAPIRSVAKRLVLRRRHHIAGGYGIFPGEAVQTVRLRFTPFRARWIRGQVWHSGQVITERPDGGLDLALPVSDFREIKMKILENGADVEVLAPATLRDAVRDELEKAARIYRAGADLKSQI